MKRESNERMPVGAGVSWNPTAVNEEWLIGKFRKPSRRMWSIVPSKEDSMFVYKTLDRW